MCILVPKALEASLSLTTQKQAEVKLKAQFRPPARDCRHFAL
jgi:hypothetical protein